MNARERPAGLQGFILLEVLASTVVCSLLLLMLAALLHGAIRQLSALKIARDTNLSQLAVESILGKVASDMDAFPIGPSPRIHRGEISFTDGTPNPIMHGASPPSPDSCAITYSAVELEASMEIRSAVRQGSDTLYTACPRYGRGFRSSDHVGVIAALPYRLAELVVSSAERGSSGCVLIAAHAPKSMLTTPLSSDQEGVTTLIPVREIYTYYLDRAGTLRRISHRGELNVEQQPMREGIKTLCFDIHDIPGQPFFELDADVETLPGRHFRSSMLHRLARMELFNFILQRYETH
jgi:hypothetical protein